MPAYAVQEELVRRGQSLTQYTAGLELRRLIPDASPVTILTAADLDARIVGPHVEARYRGRGTSRPGRA
jgi:hypothetical protein